MEVAGVWAVVVAGGTGRRFGGPKQFAPLAGGTVLDRSVRVAAAHAEGVVAVVTGAGPLDNVRVVVPGGATRSDSVRAGLAAVPDGADVIVVHDAARPLATAALWRAVIGAVRAGADAAIPAIEVTDTLKRVSGDRVVATLEREGLVAVQTPQAFRASALRAAHAAAGEATDDAALVEAHGGQVVVVEGELTNLKITLPADLELATWLLEREMV